MNMATNMSKKLFSMEKKIILATLLLGGGPRMKKRGWHPVISRRWIDQWKK